MRTLASVVVVIAVVFLGVMAFFYFKDGSLQAAGAHVDNALSKADETTKPLQDSVGEVGDATKETIHRATDGNDHT
jgi:hypothetical protein